MQAIDWACKLQAAVPRPVDLEALHGPTLRNKFALDLHHIWESKAQTMNVALFGLPMIS